MMQCDAQLLEEDVKKEILLLHCSGKKEELGYSPPVSAQAHSVEIE